MRSLGRAVFVRLCLVACLGSTAAAYEGRIDFAVPIPRPVAGPLTFLAASAIPAPPGFTRRALTEIRSQSAMFRRLSVHDDETSLLSPTAVVAALESPLRSPVPKKQAPPAPERSLPSRIGPYTIRGLLGEGGMGVVYQAHSEAEGFAAVKQARSPAFANSIRSEGRFLARLRHASPSLPVLLRTGIDASGLPYVATVLIPGIPLHQWVAQREKETGRRGLPWTQAAELGTQILGALHAAHRRGIVHRDVKPANVLVHLDGARWRITLTDWGIAGDMRGPWDSSKVSGSLRYMAPEQKRGARPHPVSDLFSVGLVIGEMVTGELLSRSSVELKALPPRMASFLTRALHPDPRQRFSSADRMRRSLQRLNTTA